MSFCLNRTINLFKICKYLFILIASSHFDFLWINANIFLCPECNCTIYKYLFLCKIGLEWPLKFDSEWILIDDWIKLIHNPKVFFLNIMALNVFSYSSFTSDICFRYFCACKWQFTCEKLWSIQLPQTNEAHLMATITQMINAFKSN